MYDGLLVAVDRLEISGRVVNASDGELWALHGPVCAAHLRSMK